jgi:hypothetical protein
VLTHVIAEITEHHDHHQPPELDGQAFNHGGGPSTLSRLAGRLEASTLAEATKEMLREALGGHRASGTAPHTPGGPHPDRRVFFDSVSVSGFRGIGRKARLPLNAEPGVTLVVGRNGSGKSSFAEGAETAFTGHRPPRQAARRGCGTGATCTTGPSRRSRSGSPSRVTPARPR